MTWSARVCSSEAKPGTNQQRAPFRGAPGIDLNQGSLLPLHPPQRLNPQQHPGPPRFCELRHTMYTKGKVRTLWGRASYPCLLERRQCSSPKLPGVCDDVRTELYQRDDNEPGTVRQGLDLSGIRRVRLLSTTVVKG